MSNTGNVRMVEKFPMDRGLGTWLTQSSTGKIVLTTYMGFLYAKTDTELLKEQEKKQSKIALVSLRDA